MIKSYNVSIIVYMIDSMLLLNHFMACLLIIVANVESDFNKSWLSLIPAPQSIIN